MIPMKSAVNINTILSQGPDISRLILHSYSLLRFQSIMRSKLNSPESEHIYLASVSEDTAILYTDSPAWASKLRFKTQQLIDIFRNIPNFPKIKTIRIKVSPTLYIEQEENIPTNLTPKTSKFLEEIADNMNDPELKSALLRLSKHKEA
jgi:hypothetical protein